MELILIHKHFNLLQKTSQLDMEAQHEARDWKQFLAEIMGTSLATLVGIDSRSLGFECKGASKHISGTNNHIVTCQPATLLEV